MRNMKKLFWILFAVLCIGCHHQKKQVVEAQFNDSIIQVAETSDKELEAAIREMGLVDVQELDSTIQIQLMYATADNFMGDTLYYGIHKAFLLPEMAQKLVEAHQLLHKEYPNYLFLIYDAARPISIQRAMWDKVKDTDQSIYVSNPATGMGMHNYGAAVDITIVDENGTPLDMGTPFDFFGKEANIDKEAQLVKEGKISQEALNNRLLLRRLMTSVGFQTIESEWWHFNLLDPNRAPKELKVIDL